MFVGGWGWICTERGAGKRGVCGLSISNTDHINNTLPTVNRIWLWGVKCALFSLLELELGQDKFIP